MRTRKLLLSILLAAIVIVQGVSLGWAAIEDERANIAVHSLHVAFALYTLIVAGRSVGQVDSAHAVSMVHLSA